jgi:N-dimethylarginine dimethylaminohydrolase
MPAVIIRSVKELGRFDMRRLAARREPQRILMCTPDYYDVVDVKNVHMEGNIGAVDKAKARAEWLELRRAFEATGHPVVTIEAVEGLEDMVFAANQVLPGVDAHGHAYVLLSRMAHPSRQKEVPYFRQWFASHGYRILRLPNNAGFFEGQGDAIWHPGKQLLWGGYGQRTSLRAYEQISYKLGVPVIALELPHASFYHLDTCFGVLREGAALYYPGAFTEAGRRLIEHFFPQAIEVSLKEAHDYFACNAVALDGKTIILQRGANKTVARLRAEGFKVVEVETNEFRKSGGSVFCLKMMIY